MVIFFFTNFEKKNGGEGDVLYLNVTVGEVLYYFY